MSLNSSLLSKRHLTGFLFVAPALCLFLVFAAFPIVRSIFMGFQHVQVTGANEWVGMANFNRVLGDPDFVTAWKNTAYFAFLALLMGFPIPIALAILINEARRGQAFLRLAYFIPVVLPIVVVALMWERFYDQDAGMFNAVIGQVANRFMICANWIRGVFGADPTAWEMTPIGWLNDARWAMPSLVFMATWKGAGATMLIYLAALQSLNGELYEAAEIDGAGVFGRLKNITLPHLLPHMQIILILQMLGTLQVFLEPFLMTNGGPGATKPTMTVLLLIYQYAFKEWHLGWAAAAGFILFVVLVLTAIIQRWLSKRIGGEGGAI